MTHPEVNVSDSSVSVIVEMLRARKRVSKAEMALGSGVSKRTLSRRLNGAHGWEWRELKQLAAYFAVPISVFDEDPATLFSRAAQPTEASTTSWSSADVVPLAA